MKNIIPQDKGDMDAVKRLQQYSIEEIKEEIPKLLEWLQDYNWPVARPLYNYFSPHINTISNELINILQGDDGMWKYWIIGLIVNSSVKPNPDLVNEIKHLAENPSQDDINCEVDIEAREFMEKYFKKDIFTVMSIEEKTSNTFLAFKFALLDSLYSKAEIIEIIRSNTALLEKCENKDLNEDSLKEIIETYSTEGDLTESNKILFELIRKKTISEDVKARPWAPLKMVDTMLWVGGLEEDKSQEIERLITFHEEVEDSEYTPAVMERIEVCVRGYEGYDIETYLAI